MEKEDYTKLTPEQEAFLGEDKKETVLRLGIPFALRFSIIWTLFFIILGVAIQSIQASSFVFRDFFISNYATWFKSFGSFVNVIGFDSGLDFFKQMIGHRYYFFYTGGLIALIWGILDWLINSEILFTRKKKPVNVIEPKQK